MSFIERKQESNNMIIILYYSAMFCVFAYGTAGTFSMPGYRSVQWVLIRIADMI